MARIFMLSPFGEPFDSYYREVIQPELLRHGHEVFRANDSYTPGVILQDIFQEILDADVVLADITRENPNVFYELGIAHSYGKQVVMIAQSTANLPFDVSHMRVLRYHHESADTARSTITDIARAIEEALDPAARGANVISEHLFSGKYFRNFREVISAAERMLCQAENYFFVTRTSPNESILQHETGYFEATSRRILGADGNPGIPNYRRLVYLNSRDSLQLAVWLLEKYWTCPNFQMAAYGSRLLPVNFEVFVSDDRSALVAFGAEQGGGPLDSALLVSNQNVAVKWKTFFLNLWEHPETVRIKPAGRLTEPECEEAIVLLTRVFEATRK